MQKPKCSVCGDSGFIGLQSQNYRGPFKPCPNGCKPQATVADSMAFCESQGTSRPEPTVQPATGVKLPKLMTWKHPGSGWMLEKLDGDITEAELDEVIRIVEEAYPALQAQLAEALAAKAELEKEIGIARKLGIMDQQLVRAAQSLAERYKGALEVCEEALRSARGWFDEIALAAEDESDAFVAAAKDVVDAASYRVQHEFQTTPIAALEELKRKCWEEGASAFCEAVNEEFKAGRSGVGLSVKAIAAKLSKPADGKG